VLTNMVKGSKSGGAGETVERARRPLVHWLMLAALVVMWGSSFLFTKIAVAAMGPTTVVASRLVLAAAVLGLVLVATRTPLARGRRAWLFFLAIAVIGNCVPFWLISWGQQEIDSGLAGIFMAVMPITTLVLAHFFVRGERLTGTKAAGFALGFLGVVVLIGPDALLELRGSGTAILYELAVLGAAVLYGVNTIIARQRPKGDALVAAAAVTIVASIVMVPAAWVGGTPWPIAIGVEAAVALAVLGIASTAAATVIFFKLIALAGPTFVSLINYLIPLWAVAVGAIFLGERPEWAALGALGLILAGIGLSEFRGRRIAAPRRG
jgi:drug/metabolite transporter (DMT)-like permease